MKPEIIKVMIGSGKIIHYGFKRGGQCFSLCGAGANRTGRNKSAFAYPVEDAHAVTCKNCQSKLVQIEAKKG